MIQCWIIYRVSYFNWFIFFLHKYIKLHKTNILFSKWIEEKNIYLNIFNKQPWRIQGKGFVWFASFPHLPDLRNIVKIKVFTQLQHKKSLETHIPLPHTLMETDIAHMKYIISLLWYMYFVEVIPERSLCHPWEMVVFTHAIHDWPLYIVLFFLLISTIKYPGLSKLLDTDLLRFLKYSK